jgi:pimeloyl-ACP methyl ester carboxylesterase
LVKAASLTKDLDRTNALAKAAGKYILSAADQPYAKMIRDFLGKPPYPKGDIADYANGNRFSSDTLGRSLTAMELRTLGLDMPVPFFVVQGRDDHIVGFTPAERYVEEIRAPAKAFIPIDGGHYACFTNPDAFVGALRKHVRPLAT